MRWRRLRTRRWREFLTVNATMVDRTSVSERVIVRERREEADRADFVPVDDEHCTEGCRR